MNQQTNPTSMRNTNQQNEDFIQFVKDCLLPRDKAKLIEMLKETADQRMYDLHHNKKILQSSFYLYLLDYDLVSYD